MLENETSATLAEFSAQHEEVPIAIIKLSWLLELSRAGALSGHIGFVRLR
jgi:hypothetical protein